MTTNKLFFLLFFFFAITEVFSQDTLYQENFETKTEAIISTGVVQEWKIKCFPGGKSINSWGFSDDSPLSGFFSLTINDGSNYFRYNRSDNCDKVAYCNTKIDAKDYYDLRLSFSWKCDGEPSDYGMIKYSTNGNKWYNLSDEKFYNQSSIHHVVNLDISTCDNKEFYLGFEWINNSNFGSNPPFTVDDIVLTGMGSVNSTTVTYPQNLAAEISQNPIIVWEKTFNALGYKLYFGTDGEGLTTPSNILNGEETKSTAYYVNSDLTANKTYYFQVVPYNSGCTASDCPIISFTTIDPDTYTSWTGATSSDWSNSGNWSNGVPDNTKNILIPVVEPGANQPTINEAATVKNITFETGGVINNSSHNLSVLGDWNDYFGTYNGNSGTVVFEGASSFLSAYANSVYVIDGLSADGSSTTGDITSTAGDYRGGIAVTKDYLYVTGDDNTVRMNASDLSGITSMGLKRDGMFSDLLTGKLYTLWGNSVINGEGTVPICPCADNNTGSGNSCVEEFTVTSLREMNEDLSLSSTIIPLIDENGNSTRFVCKGGQNSTWVTRTGIYPGYGFVCIFADNESGSENMYVIDIQSGVVKDMGFKNITPEMEISESWATWGFGEFDGEDYHLIYKMKDEDRFRRVNLTTMDVADFADFTFTADGLGKMSCITFSPWQSRWYFLHKGPSEFNNTAAAEEEIAGYALGSNIITIDGGQPEVLTNVQINKTNSTDKLTLNSSITVNNLTIINGDLDVSTDNRKVTVKGDLDIQSNGIFTKRLGTVLFEGSLAQTISGTTDFYNFEINKTAEKLTLSNDLNISNNLNLNKGIISTGANSVCLSNILASSLIGGDDDCFVYGNLKRKIASNTDTYSFPVGLGTATTDYYRLNFINNNIEGVSCLTTSAKAITEFGNNVDANLVTVQSNGNPYTNLVEGAVWNISPDNSPSGGSYGVNLYFGNQLASLTDNQFGVLKRSTGSTDYKDWDSFYSSTTIPVDDAAGRTIADGYAQRTGFTSLCEYGIATTPFSLPIELINFNAQCNNNIITLSWATASEENNDYFTLEKSFDAQNFDVFTTVPAAGFSNSVLNYSADDNSFENNEYQIIYYRLKQTDYDGRFTYSDIIKVSCSSYDKESFEIKNFYVNNSDKTIKFSVNSATDSKINIRLVDVYGRVLMKFKKNVYSGINNICFTNSSLKSGIYFLEVNDNKKFVTKKIVLN
ncbi:MAG: T9SS type A sorting domain-containing protein [Bacteroidetes bacterium]|nr:T9SS type A sorting domain-containing protein [Bacteroidota bacterium]